MAKKDGGTFRVHVEDNETEEREVYTVFAKTSEEASAIARKRHGKPCWVRKCKLDREKAK